MKIPKDIKEQILFALEDDNEVMTSALDPDSGLDKENKAMNRDLIKRHNKIIDKVEKGDKLTKMDLQLIRDANEIDANDELNLREHHKIGVKLDKWIEKQIGG